MSQTLGIRVNGANRQPLRDRFTLTLTTEPHGVHLLSSEGLTTPILIDGLSPVQTYQITIEPLKHRPVSRFVATLGDYDLYAPVNPSFVTDVQWSPSSRVPLAITNHADTLTKEERAGLSNIYASMVTLALWPYVTWVYRVKPDRILADVSADLADVLDQSPDFAVVDGSLHDPPEGFTRRRSYKYQMVTTAVLQVTLFQGGSRWKADIDLDDNAGFWHLFDVAKHTITGSATHPYDIHQALVFRGIDPLYTPLT